MGVTRLTRILAATLLLAGTTAVAKRPAPASCSPGTFGIPASDQVKVASLVGQAVDVFTLGPTGAVTLGPCGAAGRVKAKRRKTIVTAAFPTCGTALKLKLVVKLAAPDCSVALGSLHAKHHKKRTRFTATRNSGGPPSGDPVCGNGVRDGAEACEGLDGCGPAERCTSTCTCEPVRPTPTVSQGLIAAALAHGDIDYPTSLVYRAWALFADSRLPPKYDGQAWQYEDNGLFREARRVWDSLDPHTQAELTPFLLRPNEPGSYHSPDVPPGGLSMTRAVPVTRADDPPPVECPFAPGAATRDWRYTETTHFVIWSCGGGDPARDPYAAKRTIVAGVAEQVWNAMTPDTVAVPADNFASGPQPTTRMDVYLLEPHRCKTRDNGCVPIPVNSGQDGASVAALAGVAGVPPCGPGPTGAKASSSFAIIDVDQVTPAPAGNGPWPFRYVFAHEFFHAIQNALNLEAQGGGCTGDGKVDDTVTSWLVEASAEWASWAYFPTDEPGRRGALFYWFQQRDAAVDSLRALGDTKPYEAFLYPFFVQQEHGGERSAFLDVWKKSGRARTAAQLDDVLNDVLPFEDHFRDFAVRNLDTTLPGNPVQPSYQAVVGSGIPTDIDPVIIEPTVALEAAPSRMSRPALMHALTAQYELYTVVDPVRYVRIDLPSAFVQADVIAEVEGTWKRRKAPGLVVEFCRDDPGDDVQAFFLVLSHYDRRPNAKVEGTYTVETRATCPAGWTGSFTYTWSHDEVWSLTDQYHSLSADNHFLLRDTWTLVGTTPGTAPDFLDTVDAVWTGSESNTQYSSEHTFAASCQGEYVRYVYTVAGSGTGPQRFTVIPGDSNPAQVTLAPGGSTGFMTSGTLEFETSCGVHGGRAFEAAGGHENTDSFDLVTEGFLPDPEDPDHYSGSRTGTHGRAPKGDDGYESIDERFEWDFRRRR